ncbi:hypothetical protein DFH08DRAFT_970641 [Mycena albidolilacea]|uniref:DUF6534 domain-containing protein n=1 Tax=Mycena albidolilacea TaxID=1033008 RepID=A0AAD6ZER7_9AGAR|nr:hypothetical protein DFH08DRAFT_970641 [Mycena albidolilacea]
MSTENIVPATGRDASRRRFYDGNIALFRAVQSSDWISKDELSAAYVDALCHQSMLTDSVRGGAAMVALLMLAIKPDSMIYIGPQFVISGLYTNALMATLNSRHRISTGSSDSDVVDLNSVHLSNMGPNASEPREGNPTRPILHHSSHSVDMDFKRDVV